MSFGTDFFYHNGKQVEGIVGSLSGCVIGQSPGGGCVEGSEPRGEYNLCLAFSFPSFFCASFFSQALLVLWHSFIFESKRENIILSLSSE